ncbi:DUF6895 family protein [Streptomyces beigongshangae]|uniref:DUF6895 family protein n=1 Tax=Streptomyces beigongshangae TaxID=2841597 RepID=UPI0021A32E71|nr:hypothetical protein [Streptomyces sp. REN17]
MSWLSAHRDAFVLGEDALAEHGSVNSTWKPLGELTQVCVSIRRHTEPGGPLHETACDLLAFAWQQVRNGDLFAELQRLEPFATYPLEIYAAFASAGLRHPGYERATATVASTRSWQVTEQQPNRRLGVLNSERRSGIPQHGEVSQALRHTWLSGLPEPWTFERDAGYTLTHVIFHLSDWGLAPQGVPPRIADYLRQWLPPWLDTCLEHERWDLSCELLAVAGILPGPPDRAMLRESWTKLARAQDTAGAVPEEGAGREGRPVARDFSGCYHSTLMTAYAAVLTARHLDESTGSTGNPGAAREPHASGHAARPGRAGRGRTR